MSCDTFSVFFKVSSQKDLMAPGGVFADFNQLIAPHLVTAPSEVFGFSRLGHCRNIVVQRAELCGWHAPFVDMKGWFPVYK